MRFLNILSLAALSAAFVIPDEQVLGQVLGQPAIDSPEPSKEKALFRERLTRPHHLLDHDCTKSWKSGKPRKHHFKDDAKKIWRGAKKTYHSGLDYALSFQDDSSSTAQEEFVAGFDVQSWLETRIDSDFDVLDGDHPPHPPPHHGHPPFRPPHHGPPKKGKRPHHPPHHHKPNLTIYEMISKSKYTTKLAKLIGEDEELVALLNSTKANFTVFAPTDNAFAKIPKGAPKPPKEFIKKVLLYHITPDVYPAGRLLFSHTVPTLLNETLLGDKAQRLVARLGFKGVAINYFSRVVAANIPATNGIIHGVDSILLPPPKALEIISLLPSEFSTLLLGLEKTGLTSTLNSTHHVGGTFFAPPNGAFKKLGPRINAFLFSKYGEKYLKALLKYHIVANHTLYSNAYYGPKPAQVAGALEEGAEADAVPYFHFDLPTLLGDRSLAIDVARYGPFISIKVNAFVRVVIQDGIAKDGVLQVVNNVLIPPKQAGGPPVDAGFWQGEEMSLEEFKGRLEPFVEDADGGEKKDWKIDL